MKNENLKKIILSALFLALALILPFFTGQVKEIGNMLLPMHIPIFLTSLICGPIYGVIVGVTAPLLRSFIFGAPKLIPSSIAMSMELMTYGFLAGYLYNVVSKYKCIRSLYKSLIISMIAGRIVWGIVSFILYNLIGMNMTLSLFLSAEFITSLPGIVIQLILIPIIMKVIGKMYIKEAKV